VDKKEQQKIADCLSYLDELIATQSQKIKMLKKHKNGLTQQLFPAEGETAPKLRFPEFKNAPEWKKRQLSEIATFKKGSGISKVDTSLAGLQPCIRYGELYTHYKETINSVVSYTNIPPEKLVLSLANDVIIPASGETQIDIATASCVLKSGIALGGDLNIIRSKINGVFLSYYLNNAKKKAIADIAQGISVVHLYANQLKTLKINIPDLPEQQKIADCLSSLDELIATQSQKIEMLKKHKRGLMQELFPSSDEVNG
jgi:type I restriction enzyme S subunit